MCVHIQATIPLLNTTYAPNKFQFVQATEAILHHANKNAQGNTFKELTAD